jgi:hypothetical protein
MFKEARFLSLTEIAREINEFVVMGDKALLDAFCCIRNEGFINLFLISSQISYALHEFGVIEGRRLFHEILL